MGAAPPNSQVAPLPSNVPFKLVSKTIGAGAYASIRKAVPLNKSAPVIAIKFINKDHAVRIGRVKPTQIEREITLHSEVSGHSNIIRYLQYGEDTKWYWIAMELAEGGDLFDKIESDEGVPEEIAHFYFKQLIAAVSWCHSKGVSHRDIKPENMLLTGDGDLKLADFGLATMIVDQAGRPKPATTLCGSPPYAAPEIFEVGRHNDALRRSGGRGQLASYRSELTDLWSCAVVLFVLLVGNTPWDIPDATQSWEFGHFVETNGRPDQDDLWTAIPHTVLSLIRGVLKVDPEQRFTVAQISSHPWFSASNKYMNTSGRSGNPVAMATAMMERLKIDMDGPASQPVPMNVDSQPEITVSSTQPVDTDAVDVDWEPSRYGAMSASQPLGVELDELDSQLSQDPTMSQFSQQPGVHPSLTQLARRFNEIAPSHGLTRYYSKMPVMELLSLLNSTLQVLDIPIVAARGPQAGSRETQFRIRTKDSRGQQLIGNVVVECISGPPQDSQRIDSSWGAKPSLTEVRFWREKGDPLEWRRMFKKVVQGCGHAVLRS